MLLVVIFNFGKQNTRETAKTIHGLSLKRAQRFLRDVIAHKQVGFTSYWFIKINVFCSGRSFPSLQRRCWPIWTVQPDRFHPVQMAREVLPIPSRPPLQR